MARTDWPHRSDLEEIRVRLEGAVAAHRKTVERERLCAFRQMAGEAAHAFTETLSGILARAQNLLDDGLDPQLARSVRMIEQVTLEGTRTVRRLQEFSRTDPVHPLESVDLNHLVVEVSDSIRGRRSEQLKAEGTSGEVRAETTPIPLVSGDVAELRHALTSIAVNGLDAMPTGGTLTFSTGTEGQRVFCRVVDTGVGMSNGVRAQIFDPFFTTKREKGPGFGLGGVYAIVDRNGGEISVESEVGKGTTFTIWLPTAQSSEVLPEPASVMPSAVTTATRRTSSPRAKILVVDDSEEVREVLRELLTGQGHMVVTCADGESGLAALETERFDLAMVDLGLPGISGLEVATQLKHRFPDTTAVVMTGYFDRMDSDGARVKGVDFVLTKPFSLNQLRLLIQNAYSGLPSRS
jgi:two-component system cell cycle sensor histidine kinase/response regulator CckA